MTERDAVRQPERDRDNDKEAVRQRQDRHTARRPTSQTDRHRQPDRQTDRHKDRKRDRLLLNIRREGAKGTWTLLKEERPKRLHTEDNECSLVGLRNTTNTQNNILPSWLYAVLASGIVSMAWPESWSGVNIFSQGYGLGNFVDSHIVLQKQKNKQNKQRQQL